MDFGLFDKRNYPTVSARDGYGEWAQTYEDNVSDLLDVRMLEAVTTVNGQNAECLDLACGTGRTGR